MTPEAPEETPELDDFDRIVASLNRHGVDFLIVRARERPSNEKADRADSGAD